MLRVPPPRVPSRDLSPRDAELLPEMRPPPAGLDPLSRLSGRSSSASAMPETFTAESVRLAWFEPVRL